MALNCWKDGDDLLVDNGYFRLRFSESRIGISSFAYMLGGCWHEVVNSTASKVLYVPQFTIVGLPGGPLVPYHSNSLAITFMGRAFASCIFECKLSNPTLGTGMNDYPCSLYYLVYEDGDLYICCELYNDSGQQQMILIEEHYLDPKEGLVLLGDTAPQIKFAGFYSNNTGTNPEDFSHDGILIQNSNDLDTYITDTNGNRNAVGLGKALIAWPAGQWLRRFFRLHLSYAESPYEITDAVSFQAIGDLLAYDYRIPDPLTGGPNEGDVLIGSLVSDGYDEAEGAYTLQPA